MARWKSACSGGQHGHRCGYLVDSERILKLVPANPCATGVPGSRNTSLPETGTKPGATPERRKNRETGTSRGYPVPAAGRLTKRPPGNQRASGQRPGQAPASHTCRGLAYFPARPIPGLAHPRAQLARSAPSAMPRSPSCCIRCRQLPCRGAVAAIRCLQCGLPTALCRSRRGRCAAAPARPPWSSSRCPVAR